MERDPTWKYYDKESHFRSEASYFITYAIKERQDNNF